MDPERIGGYEILSELGRGAMGVVYHAHDSAIGRPVAIKVIRIDAGMPAAESLELRQRLIREASAAGQIYHPGIVTVHQLGEEGDNVFIVMEYVEGASLDRLLTSNPEFGSAWALDVLAQVAVALDYAHKSNVVHRDIKPANILVRSDGRVKIADFGIAKFTSGAATGMTGTGVSLGSPAYMSPEQIQATQIDGRSDQFALGTIAFLMLTGRMPFKGDTAHSLMYQIVTADPFAMLDAASLAPGVRAVLARALAKSPTDRYPDCAAFIQELTEAVGVKAAVASAAAAKIATLSAPPAPPPAAPPSKESQRWILLAIAGAVLTLVLIGAGIYGYLHRGSSSESPSDPGTPVKTVTKEPAEEANGTNALLAAVASGNIERVKSLIAKGANVDQSGADGTTPLMLASEGTTDNEPMMQALLDAGAHIDSVVARGRSSLHRAAAAGKTAEMAVLLDHQANINLRATDFSTPLLEAVSHDRLDAAQLLIDRGADVNLGDSNNSTPLMIAAQTSPAIPNPAGLIRLLLKHSAKRGAKDGRGRIAFQIAVETKNAPAVQLLR